MKYQTYSLMAGIGLVAVVALAVGMYQSGTAMDWIAPWNKAESMEQSEQTYGEMTETTYNDSEKALEVKPETTESMPALSNQDDLESIEADINATVIVEENFSDL